MERHRLIEKDLKRIVVKVGTALLTSGTSLIDRRQIAKIVRQISNLSQRNVEIVLVTSGAIASGMSKLKISRRPEELPFLQSCAAIGQNQLMRIYDEYFSKSGLLTAQILLTRDDLSHRKRYLNAKNTILTLLKYKTIPIVNENDTVSVEEIKFGDNDKLAALVASLIEADILVLLSNIAGLCYKERGGTTRGKIGVVKKITSFHKELACGPGRFGTGGMVAKLEAAKIATDSGIYTIIADGRKKNVLIDILERKDIGTLFLPAESRLAARKKWIAFGVKTKGVVTVDDGAKEALLRRGKSLLSAGIKKIEGDFSYGDSIILTDEKGNKFAKGLINYSSKDLEKIKGRKTSEIEKILGVKYYDEVIHRDNLILLDREG
jgi:glutamate 5-kinase